MAAKKRHRQKRPCRHNASWCCLRIERHCQTLIAPMPCHQRRVCPFAGGGFDEEGGAQQQLRLELLRLLGRRQGEQMGFDAQCLADLIVVATGKIRVRQNDCLARMTQRSTAPHHARWMRCSSSTLGCCDIFLSRVVGMARLEDPLSSHQSLYSPWDFPHIEH